jgi:hypothetical protein
MNGVQIGLMISGEPSALAVWFFSSDAKPAD